MFRRTRKILTAVNSLSYSGKRISKEEIFKLRRELINTERAAMNFVKQEYNVVGIEELEKTFKSKYRHHYNILRGEDGEGIFLREYLLEKEPLDTFDTEDVFLFTETGEGDCLLDMLMQDMVNKEVFPEGRYLVTCG